MGNGVKYSDWHDSSSAWITHTCWGDMIDFKFRECIRGVLFHEYEIWIWAYRQRAFEKLFLKWGGIGMVSKISHESGCRMIFVERQDEWISERIWLMFVVIDNRTNTVSVEEGIGCELRRRQWWDFCMDCVAWSRGILFTFLTHCTPRPLNRLDGGLYDREESDCNVLGPKWLMLGKCEKVYWKVEVCVCACVCVCVCERYLWKKCLKIFDWARFMRGWSERNEECIIWCCTCAIDIWVIDALLYVLYVSNVVGERWVCAEAFGVMLSIVGVKRGGWGTVEWIDLIGCLPNVVVIAKWLSVSTEHECWLAIWISVSCVYFGEGIVSDWSISLTEDTRRCWSIVFVYLYVCVCVYLCVCECVCICVGGLVGEWGMIWMG